MIKNPRTMNIIEAAARVEAASKAFEQRKAWHIKVKADYLKSDTDLELRKERLTCALVSLDEASR